MSWQCPKCGLKTNAEVLFPVRCACGYATDGIHGNPAEDHGPRIEMTKKMRRKIRRAGFKTCSPGAIQWLQDQGFFEDDFPLTGNP